ncbi:tryptophan 7-halogenase [Aliiglaciecola sp. LCG003]|uniref:NAD(P)/FAD-dependent oxidoreductase n=1 Tax=Aliiglaciecola sp. LCG003 TaxID=3053655 RepID=UPI0025725F05|nr:tryptophan 7-halogenase [Aliiglaciecola sp. LCG003]WJG09974.1 tryptophan 7-halogenase [Aliiglaciecola sp. LCG003]
MLDDSDVAIIGAGPAACATALSLHKLNPSIKICLFDAATGPQSKVGESIPPAAVPILFNLLGDAIYPFLDLQQACPGNISIWGDNKPGHNDFIYDLNGQGYHLNRQTLEKLLQDKVQQAGMKLFYQHRLCSADTDQHRVNLTFNHNHHTRHISSRFAVDASGISRALIQQIGVAKNVLDEVIFICATFDAQNVAGKLRHTLIEATADGWWYCALLPDNKYIVSFCSDRQQLQAKRLDRPDVWLAELHKSTLLREQLVPSDLAQVKLFKRAAPSSILSTVIGQCWMAVGDAASSFDPITSAGITKSLLNGQQAADAIHSWLTDASRLSMSHYQNEVFNDFNQYVGLRDSLYRSEVRFDCEPFWYRRNHLGQSTANGY